jgi:hypothetical protein
MFYYLDTPLLALLQWMMLLHCHSFPSIWLNVWLACHIIDTDGKWIGLQGNWYAWTVSPSTGKYILIVCTSVMRYPTVLSLPVLLSTYNVDGKWWKACVSAYQGIQYTGNLDSRSIEGNQSASTSGHKGLEELGE